MTLRNTLSLSLALGALLAFSAPGAALAKDQQRIRVALVNTGVEPAASGQVDYRLKKQTRARFKVEVEDLTPANYDLVVGGSVVGTLDVQALPAGGSEGELEFDSKSSRSHLPLNFDPRGQLIEVVRAATVYLQVVLPNPPPAPSSGNSHGAHGSSNSSGSHG
jgi:hypothetical protein